MTSVVTSYRGASFFLVPHILPGKLALRRRIAFLHGFGHALPGRGRFRGGRAGACRV